jgi:group I intron endonuclease
MITLMAYVGKTSDFDDRMEKHEDPKKNPNTLITTAINKYGWENFKVEILIDNVPKEQQVENLYIQRENTRTPNGYNERRGEGSGTACYDEQHKKWKVMGPGPEFKFVGYYFTEEKAERARKLFVRTGERMKSDIIRRKRGTGTIGIAPSGRFRAEITVKGERYYGTFDTEEECEVFFKHIRDTYS